MIKSSLLTIGILGILAIIFLQSQQVQALTTLIASGDFGGKSSSIDNLKNIDATNRCFIGIGDYMYDKHPETFIKSEGKTLGELWDNISCKIGFPGNHEELKHQEEQWAQDVFKYGTQGYAAWKLGDVGIIGISAYADFEKGSKQYEFVKNKAQAFDLNPLINHIVFVTHEPLWTPSIEGGHGPNTDLRNTFQDIIKIHNGFLIQAHNHVIAFGNNEGVSQVVCGGGGYGGDSLTKLSGFDWASTKSGYCEFTFNEGMITAKAIAATDGKTIMKQQLFRK